MPCNGHQVLNCWIDNPFYDFGISSWDIKAAPAADVPLQCCVWGSRESSHIERKKSQYNRSFGLEEFMSH